MADDRIVERVRKLLRLAHHAGTSVHEAQNALAAAQKLMFQHRLHEADLDEPVDPASIVVWRDEPLETGAAIPDWRQAVGAAIALANDAMCIVIGQRRDGHPAECLVVVGRAVDVQVTREMYSWVVARVEAIARQQRLVRASQRRRVGVGRRWLRSFRNGAAASIEERLALDDEATRAALPGAQCRALDQRRGAVATWMQEHAHLVEADARPSDNDADGWRSGRRAGQELPLRPAPRERLPPREDD